MKSLKQSLSITLASLSLVLFLSACRDEAAPVAPAAVAAVAPVAKCHDCGTVTGIEQMKAKGTASGVGAVAGAVVGAVIGHQVGDGKGKDVATVAGAIGGGLAGNEIEKMAKGTVYYHVTVAMETGGTRSVDLGSLNGLTTGARVKLIGNGLQLAGA